MFEEPTPEYGSYEIALEQKINYIDETTGLQSFYFTSYPLELELCGTKFNYSNQEEIIYKGIDKYYCLKNKTQL
jgi:hypothetical protein